MSDRELLELAAKAAGIEVRFFKTVSSDCRSDLGELPYTCKPHQRQDERKRVEDWMVAWNPLTDDGDALRLAVKLGLYIEGKFTAHQCVKEFVELGELTAVRRAIVRAAAEIGRSVGP